MASEPLTTCSRNQYPSMNIAGTAIVLSYVHSVTGDERYQKGVDRALTLLQKGARRNGLGVEWNDSTDIISGSAGIGLALYVEVFEAETRRMTSEKLGFARWRTGDEALVEDMHRLLQAAEIHDRVLLAEDVLEAALRQPPMQRHLPAFEALDGHAGARGLALAAAPAGLALARADAAADADAVLASAGIVGKLVEFHCFVPFA